MKCLTTFVGLLPSLLVASEISTSSVQMPPGIGIRPTIEGLAFVDAKGMTLYKLNARDTGASESCDYRADAVLQYSTVAGKVDFPVKAPDLDTRRTCLQKRPPLLAPADAQPIGGWSIHVLEDGTRQWAYEGAPLHTSIKDKAPGEINGIYPYMSQGGSGAGRWNIASLPLQQIGAPAGVIARKTALGLALASPEGKTLYYSDRGKAAVRSQLWKPLAAPALATVDRLPDWSVVRRSDGLRQWAYKGRPLYTYLHDSGPEFAHLRFFGDVYGGTYGRPIEGWRVALLKESPAYPADVTITPLIDNNFYHERTTSTLMVYSTPRGMTLYVIECVEDTGDQLDCDDVGDSPRYWLSFCGGEQRCAETWKPFIAPANAKPVDNMWSITTINPRHPWKPLDKDTQGVRVWTYRGRPVFTYAHDLRPGDFNGANTTPGAPFLPVRAKVLLAFETAERAS